MSKSNTSRNVEVAAFFDRKQDVSWWQDEEDLKHYCAEQLFRGRLVLVLGAGVSQNFGLPGWRSLMRNAYKQQRIQLPQNEKSSLDLAEDLLTRVCQEDGIKFSEIIRKALYRGFRLSPQALGSKEWLNAIGALMMPSIRGNVKEVVTFNFDDLLETYLNYFGFVSQSVSRLPVWNTRADVRVYHPHGLLPIDMNKPIEHEILLARIQFDAQEPNLKSWYEKLSDVFQSNTCLFIGLSGDDENLSKLLKRTHGFHVARSHGSKDHYWGIRFSDKKKDPNKQLWEERGVYQQTLTHYKMLPSWLFDICKIASGKIIVT